MPPRPSDLASAPTKSRRERSSRVASGGRSFRRSARTSITPALCYRPPRVRTGLKLDTLFCYKALGPAARLADAVEVLLAADIEPSPRDRHACLAPLAERVLGEDLELRTGRKDGGEPLLVEEVEAPGGMDRRRGELPPDALAPDDVSGILPEAHRDAPLV